MCNSLSTPFRESGNNYWRIAGRTHTILQIKQSACKPSQYSSYGVPHEEQRGKDNVNVKWNRTDLENRPHPNYLGATLDRILSYKQHIHNTKMEVARGNNLLRKMGSSKWGANRNTLRTTTLLLSYSVAEYAPAVWARWAHTYKLDSKLNSACPVITGGLKPTNVEELYLLVGIALLSIRWDIGAKVEIVKQETNKPHSLYGKIPAERRFKSRNCLLYSVNPANFPPNI